MSRINKNAINALPKILKRLSNQESLNLEYLSQEYDAPISTLRDNINKHLVKSFSDNISFLKSTNSWLSNKDFLSETMLTAEEIVTISILENSSSQYGKEFEKNSKLLFNRFKRRASLQIYKKTNFEKITRKDDIKFALIKNAITFKHKLKCEYRNKLRIIYPLKIVMFDGFWYALIYQEDEKQVKTFHLKSIENIKNTNEKFELNIEDLNIKLDSAINAYFKDKKSKIIELFVHRKIVQYFERCPLSKNQIILSSEDENYKIMQISVTDYMEIIPTIQQFLPFIKVCSPKDLEEKILQHIDDYGESDLSHYF
ncbi:hypothetical protein CPG38_04365 [Malaciobacter marinus]|uniref:helix-turn-helix transcriptional regulator n=1 Tax=Malaciobacter marinus TaxID=505249 RepID=UPI000C07A351|nr:WYL domain-containing protein [Malaciobacter marinus]PHO13197.1 hypothetical protein CPG38_04365 [Malaciobacter marinus]